MELVETIFKDLVYPLLLLMPFICYWQAGNIDRWIIKLDEKRGRDDWKFGLFLLPPLCAWGHFLFTKFPGFQIEDEDGDWLSIFALPCLLGLLCVYYDAWRARVKNLRREEEEFEKRWGK